ncbi:MAG TPA: DUF6049 family protein [Acidimicrobiia bacterium]
MKRLLRALLGALVAALFVASPAAPVAAQTTTSPSIVLAGQDAWDPVGGTFTALLGTTGSLDGLHLTLTVHDRVVSRSAFDATLADNPTFPPTLRLLDLSLDDYPPDAFGLRTLSVPLASLNVRRSGNGVYPVEVQLRDADAHIVDGFVTHVVVADPNAAGTPLDVAWVWPLVDPPAIALDGTHDAGVVADLASDGRLGRQAAAIGHATDVPLTLAPSPETLDSWSTLSQGNVDLAAGAAALRDAVPEHQVIVGPYVNLDLPSLFRSNLGSRLGDELDRGASALEAFFGTHLDPSTAMPGPLDATSLVALSDARARRLVVDGDALEPYQGRFTPARPARLEASAGGPSDTTVVATDSGVERFLSAPKPPAHSEPGLRAAHLLAALAVVAGEQPSLTRGVAFANPVTWDADPTLMNALLTGLRGNPLLKPVTVDTMLTEAAPATVDDPEAPAEVRVLAPVTPTRAPVTAQEYQAAVSDRNGIADLFGPTDPRVQRADRVLHTVLAASGETPTGRALAASELAGIGQLGRDFLSRIRVPDPSTVTLTSSRAQIPLTFRNDADRRVGIHIALSSSKLLFPDGTDRDVVLQPGKNETVRIAVETRSSGTYPLDLTVTTAGGLPIQTSEVTVRSSFVSGVGVFLTVAALLFLAGWWAWDIRRRRRARRAAATA